MSYPSQVLIACLIPVAAVLAAAAAASVFAYFKLR